jgi:hypothetical protein
MKQYKEMNEMMYRYIADFMRKNIELQTSLFKDLIKLNKELLDLSPVKPLIKPLVEMFEKQD